MVRLQGHVQINSSCNSHLFLTWDRMVIHNIFTVGSHTSVTINASTRVVDKISSAAAQDSSAGSVWASINWSWNSHCEPLPCVEYFSKSAIKCTNWAYGIPFKTTLCNYSLTLVVIEMRWLGQIWKQKCKVWLRSWDNKQTLPDGSNYFSVRCEFDCGCTRGC